MPRNNSLLAKVKRALKGHVFKAKSESELETIVWRSVRTVIHRTGVKKTPDVISMQADSVVRSLFKNVEDLNEGGVQLTIL